MLNLNKLYKRAQGHSTMEKQKKIASCITIGRGGGGITSPSHTIPIFNTHKGYLYISI